MGTGPGVRVGAGVILALAVAACTGAGAATTVPAVPAGTERPSLSPSPSPSPSTSPVESATPAETAAPTVSAAPSKSAKPLPSFDQADLDAVLTSSITLIDLADDDLSVIVSMIDPSTDEAIDLGTYLLESTDQMTSQVPPGTYRLDFRQPANSATGPSCSIEISDTDGYIFAAVPDAIAVSRTGAKPKNAGELFVATSSLCGK